MSKLAIVVGHTQADKGAFSTTLNAQEYDWNSDLANRILAIEEPRIEKKIFYRDDVGISGAYGAGDVWQADAFIELHFNSSHNSSSTGTGVLYQTAKSKPFAQTLFNELQAILNLMPWPERSGGICTPYQASGQQERGKGSLTASTRPSVLIEPFFGSNPRDASIAQEGKPFMATAIVKAAVNFFS